MDFVLGDRIHDEHDSKWVLYSTHYCCPVCFGCITEILETSAPPAIRTKPALAELLRLLSQQSNVFLQIIIHEDEVVWHLVHTLLNMLKLEDESVVSMTIDTLLMLVKQTESDELVRGILASLSQQVTMVTDGVNLLPHYTLIGKLLYQLPPLSAALLQEHDDMLSQLGLSLCSAEETSQSAIAYIFIFVCEGSFERLMSPRLHQLVCRGIVTMLNTTQSQSVRVNGLGLLKKLVSNEASSCLLMSVNMEGRTLMSGLKKMLLTKTDILKISIAQILSELLKREASNDYSMAIIQSNLAEFLFEALHTENTLQLECVLSTLTQLSQTEQFYKRCLAVYGIESVIRAISTAHDLKNTTVMKHSLSLLTQILIRQPKDIPLFVSGSVVRKCLGSLQLGVGHHQVSLTVQGIKATAAIVTKEYLLAPVPFDILGETILTVAARVWQLLYVQKRSQKTNKKENDYSQEIISSYIELIYKACGLLQSWKNHPIAWESNFSAPSLSKGDNSLQDSFTHLLLQTLDENFLPLMMIKWESLENPVNYDKCVSILSSLPKLDPSAGPVLILKLVEAGCLATILDTKVILRSNPDIQEKCAYFMWLACDLDHRQNDQFHCMLKEDDFVTGVKDADWQINGLAEAVLKCDLTVNTIQVYLTILFLSVKYDNSVISEMDMQCVLIALLEHQTSLDQLSPLAKKRYLYLIQHTAQHSNMATRQCLPNSFQSIIDLICKNPSDVWYTHTAASLHWCFNDPVFASTCGCHMLKAWLANTQMTNVEPSTQGDVSQDVKAVLLLCKQTEFLGSILISMATAGTEDACKLSSILKLFINEPQQNITDIQADTETLLESQQSTREDERKTLIGYIHCRSSEVLLSVLLKAYPSSRDHNVSALLDVLLSLTPDTDTLPYDVKILCHVLNILADASSHSEPVLKSCIATLLSVVPPTNTGENQVVRMLIQNKEALVYFETCLRELTSLYPDVCELTSRLISNVDNHTQVPHQISLDISKLVLRSIDKVKVTKCSSLQLLASLFLAQMKSGIVIVTGKVTPNAYRTLYIYIQQLVVELAMSDNSKTNVAVNCLESLLNYLQQDLPDLGEELLSNPWNQSLLRFLAQLCIDVGSLNQPALTVFMLVLSQPTNQKMIISSPELFTLISNCVTLKCDLDLSHLKTILKDASTMIKKSSDESLQSQNEISFSGKITSCC